MFAASSGGKAKKGPAWMGAGSAKGKQRAAAEWKPSERKPADPEATWRAIRALVTLAAAVLLGVYVYFVLTRPGPTPVVVLRPAPYPLQMPPVALAAEDAEFLTRLSPTNLRAVPVTLNTAPAALKDFQGALKSAAAQFHALRRGPNMIIVHVVAHGMLDEQGNACIVPPGANSFDSSTWLSLASLFKAIADEPGLKGRDKLVLLDCQRVVSSWRSGWLENRFFEGVGTVVAGQKDPQLCVITSAGEGQLSWAAPELRGSTFAHFLGKGLRGEAAPTHRALTLGELFRYVAVEIDRYSQGRRGVRQQPVLFHVDKQYRLGGDEAERSKLPESVAATTLCYIDPGQARRKLSELQSDFDPLSELKKTFDGQAARKSAADEVNSARSLTEVWALYYQRRQPEPPNLPGYVLNPVAWSSVEQRLSSIGQRLLAGREYQGQTLQTEINQLGDQLADDGFWRADGRSPLLDIPQRLRFGDPAAETAGSGNIFAAYKKAEPDKRAEAIPKQLSRTRLVQDIYDELTQTPAGDAREALSLAAELLQRAPRTDQRLATIEEHFVTLLDRGLMAGQPLPAASVQAVLKARQQAELAANPIDLRVHYAIEKLVNEADEARRQAEDKLFLDPAAPPPSEADYQAAIDRGGQVAQWLRLRDEVWSDLPLLAEWNAVRAIAGGETPSEDRLAEALQRSVDLDRAIEEAIETRDHPPEGTTYEHARQLYDELVPIWQTIRGDLAAIYERSTNVEQAYRRPEDLRSAEIAICWPPMGGNFGQFLERYLQTLAESSSADASSRLPPPKKRSPASHAVLRQLHRLLHYEFVDPYDKHGLNTAWDTNPPPDVVFRTPAGAEVSAWSRVGNLLNQYRDAIASESPAWSESERAFAATERLRNWDRRVRVAAPWLSSFQANLQRPTQPIPTQWLQEYDAAHLAAWHAFRAAKDFWGNGDSSASGTTPYFVAAIGQCDVVMPQELRPLRYDVPGASVLTLSQQSGAALAAYRAADLQFPRSFNSSATATANQRIDLELHAAADTSWQAVPEGTAALWLAAPGGGSPAAGGAAPAAAPRVSFSVSSEQPAQGVPMPLADRSFSATAFLAPAGDNGQPASPPALEGRLWYRGHVKTRPLPLASRRSQYIEFEVTQPRYEAPLVEVRGRDTPRGAFLFVLDCSTSMQGAVGQEVGFVAAQRELLDLLDYLRDLGGDALQIGLMAYGNRTNAAAGYYAANSRRGGSPVLTQAGQRRRTELGLTEAQFAQRFPHPDGDVSPLVPLTGGKLAAVRAAIENLRKEQCIGVTPLYYSITQAIQTAVREAADQPMRRIYVISDGVNMPYDLMQNYTLGSTGRQVNDEDFAALDRALADNRELVHVTVDLFARGSTPLEIEQYRALQSLARRHPNFELVESGPTLIKESLIESLPKSRIEVSPATSSGAAVPLAFNAPLRIPDWDNPGVLRRELERRFVRLKVPGENRTLEKPIDLLGGEQVVLAYDGSQARLSFVTDTLTPRRAKAMDGPAGADVLKLQFEALAPERVGNTIRAFQFRLRDEDHVARLTPRPRYVWLEMRPLGAVGDEGDLVYPCLDAVWLDSVNLPRLEAPVQRWPDAPAARVQAWIRYSDPLTTPTATITRDSTGQTLTLDRQKWQITHIPAEEGSPRRIVVRYAPAEPEGGVAPLQERAVWLHPAPQHIRRSYALDGSEAVHEFTYTDFEAQRAPVQVRIVSRDQFQQGAYSTQLDFDTN